jgi:hypothetical protein
VPNGRQEAEGLRAGSIADARKRLNLALRTPLAASLFVLGLGIVVVAGYATAYRATSGCEDAGIACREAHPVEASIAGGLAACAVVALLVAAVRLLRDRNSKRAIPALGVATLFLGLWLLLLQVG